MGSIDGRRQSNGYIEEALKRWSAYIICLGSFFVSMVGGLVLVYWQIKYHPHNRQLWMVPFGLIMFGTPPFVWFISIAADACCPKEQQLPLISESSQLDANSVSHRSIHEERHDPER